MVGRAADASLSDLDVGATVLQLTRKAGEAGLRMDPELVMLGKTLLNLDQVAATLDPDFEPREALRRHTSELMRSSMHTSPAAMMASLLEAKEFVEALPGRVNRAFDAIGEGHFELRVKAFDEDEFLRGLHKLANVIAAGLILASMILASALLARTSGEAPTDGEPDRAGGVRGGRRGGDGDAGPDRAADPQRPLAPAYLSGSRSPGTGRKDGRWYSVRLSRWTLHIPRRSVARCTHDALCRP